MAMAVWMAVALSIAALAVAVLPRSGAPALAAFPQEPPNDPLFDASPLPNAINEHWDLASPALGFDRGISADRAWPITVGRGAVIADIDTGVSYEHEDLAGQWATNPGETGTDAAGRDRRSNGRDDDRNGRRDDWRGFDFFTLDESAEDDTANGHGTLVAGTLAAAGDNGRGGIGVAPGAGILPVRDHNTILPHPDRLAQSIVYAVDRGADVISMSLGSIGNSRAQRAAVAYAERKGTVVVAAMGNEFHFHRNVPVIHDTVIKVGGVNPDTAGPSNQAGVATRFDVKAAYSDYGPHIDLVAPTSTPSTTYPNGYTTEFAGTSAATPHVAGVAALVIARGRDLGLRLTAGEVRQILRSTAQDLTGSPYDYPAGFDRLTGYGRVHAQAAVAAVEAVRIPPAVNLTSPEWYAPLRGPARVRAAIASRAYPVRWTLEAAPGGEPGAGEPGEFRPIASGTLSRATRGGVGGEALARLDPRAFDAAGTTLRLRATDARGNTGEDRGFVFRLRDRGLKRRFPLRIGASGESSPQLGQIDGRRGLEIVLATADGLIHVLSGRTGRPLPGWPRRTASTPGSHPTARRVGPLRPMVAATPAVGDLDRDRRPEIVMAGLDGRVRVFDRRGRMRRGFPVRIDLRAPRPKTHLDSVIYASPAIGDLDGDRRPDIVVGAADQKIYAWNGRGRRLRGWPVLARDGQDGDEAKILSSPALGDLDGDRRLDVVEGTAEAYGATPSGSGRVHAFGGDGRPKPGWPVRPPSIAPDPIPLAGEGVPGSPVLADVDGDGRDEVAAAAVAGHLQLYRGDGTSMGEPHFQSTGRGEDSPSTSTASRNFAGNGALGRLRDGAPLRYFAGIVDDRLLPAAATPGQRIDFEHLLGGWDAAGGSFLPAFPRVMEGWSFLNAPAVADVDGQGGNEVVFGSSGGLLHAFGESGADAPGWPKQTGGWLIASPAIGDVDGDRRLEVVQMTREGYLFVWDTPSRAAAREWPVFRHDPRNTGRYLTRR